MAGSTQKERVELLQEHKNAGTTYPAGEELDVSPSTAAWLYRNNIAKPATAKQSISTLSEPEA